MILHSFRARLLALILLVLLPAGFLLLNANIKRQAAEKARLRTEAVSAAELAAASQAYYVKQARQLLRTMTQFDFLVLATNLPFCQTGMANLKLLSPDFSDFGLIERDGTVFCHTLGGNLKGEVISSEFVNQVMKTPKFSMSELHYDPSTDDPTLQFLTPIVSSNRQVLRFMYGSIKLPLLSAALSNIPLPVGGSISVMDKVGNIVAHHPSAEAWVGKNLAMLPSVKNALKGDVTVMESEGLGGIKQVFAISTVREGAEPLLFIQVAVPQKALFAQADAEFGGSLLGMVLIGGIVLAFSRWFSEKAFLRPISAMMNATDRLTRGEDSARTGITGGKSELHILAHRFDTMADTLGRRKEELEKAHAELIRSNEQLENRVIERTSELQILNTELEAFSYSVSHDLRAPLRHMDGFAQMLAKEENLQQNPKALRYLGLITKSAKQMGILIDDLLSFSRMARQSMTVAEVDTRKLVDRIIKGLEGEQGRKINWRLVELPKVQGDESMLRQVWVNLLSNAIKYTGKVEEPVIEISSHKLEKEVVFLVRDNGDGFNMAYADKLFGVFQRLHREDEFEGTGIGLASVRRIVHRHGGRTWAEGKKGIGATFYFSLPFSTGVSPSVPLPTLNGPE